jgi:hypothetical protein
MRNPYTKILIRYLARLPETPEIVAEWIEEEPDPRKRVLGYALQLSEDFAQDFVESWGEKPEGDEYLISRLMAEGFRRTNWTLVARAILRKFSPDIPAIVVTTRPSSN